MRGSRTGIALLLAAGLAGCGSSRDNSRPGLTPAQRQTLVRRLEAVRTSAAARDVAGTTAAVGAFRGLVVRLRHAGAIDDATARSLRVGAARILTRVRSDNAPPPQPAAPPATTPAPAPPPPGQKKKDEHKHPGKGKGHSKEGD